MTNAQNDTPAPRLTPMQWAICITAAIGFAFDSYVLLMLPLIVRPALVELLHVPATDPSVNAWVGTLFNVPAIAGGIFGLLGGYLTDIFGRRRVLVWSILLYAISGFAAGYSTTVYQLLFWRCCMFVGVCVEFVAAVAWLAELFTHPKQREAVIGYTQAFGSMGGLMVAGAYYLVVTYAESPAAGPRHARGLALHADVGHRPRDPVDRHSAVPAGIAGVAREEGGRHAQAPQLRRAVPPRVPPDDDRDDDHDGVRVRRGVRRDSADAAHRARPGGGADASRAVIEQTVSKVSSFQEIGGLAGRIALAFLAVHIVSRRKLLHIFQIPGLIVLPIVFLIAATSSLTTVKWGIGIVGFLTIAQFSFWGNYLPRVYPTYLRGTGESFAANVGGRMIGTTAALLTTSLVASMPGATPAIKLGYAAALVGTLAYVIGFTASWWLPEPKKEDLPD